MLIKAILLGILGGLGRVDSSVIQLYWHRPLVTGLLVGLILGDIKTGLIAGATLELAWMGLVPLAGAQPPDPVVGGILGTAFVILTKQPPETAVAFALPFAVAAQTAKTLLYNVWIGVTHKADKYAEEGDMKNISRIHIGSLAVHFLFYGFIVFLPIYVGTETATAVVSALPEKLMTGLSIAGRIMPAVGLATLLKIMLKKEYYAFLILGFVASVYLKIPTLGVAMIGIAIVLLQMYSKGNISGNEEVETDGI